MTTVRRGGGVPPQKVDLQKADLQKASDVDTTAQTATAEPLAADATTADAKQALRSLALDVKVESSTQNEGAEAATLGAKFMNYLRGDGGKKLYAAVGLGVSMIGMVQPAMAEVVHVAPAATDLASNSGPASSWLTQEPGVAATENAAPLSPQQAMIKAMSQANAGEKPTLRLTQDEATWHNSSEVTFRVPSAMRDVKDGQSVLVPLKAGRKLHMIELKYQDTRKLSDLEFNRTAPGGGWETFRGDEYHSTVVKEKAGELQVKRESDHNAPWINNPVRVKVEVVDADGEVIHSVGKKFLDFHVHDAHSADSSGYPETDNISNSYESLPQGELPDGAMLKLTPMHENRKAWEADREVAMDLSWVKPIYMPEHSARTMVRTGGFEKPNPAGYDVEAGRPIAAVFVKWTDHGGMASGRVKIATEDGTHRSSRYNVGSGETELIPLDGVVSKDGKLHIEGGGLEVGSIEVLYQ